MPLSSGFTPSLGAGRSYVVKPGDTLPEIAEKLGVQLERLMAANPKLDNSSAVQAGEVVRTPSWQPRTTAVTAGETLADIAALHGTSLQQLQQANPQLNEHQKPFVGQLIHLPPARPERPVSNQEASPDTRHYRVQAGDTIEAIAQRFRVGAHDLLQANPDLPSPGLLYPGRRIRLPAGTKEPQSIQPTGSGQWRAGSVSLGPLGSNAAVHVTAGARIEQLDEHLVRALSDVLEVWTQHSPVTPTITSGNDGRHMARSPHFENRAIDLRANQLVPDQAEALSAELAARLGNEFTVRFAHIEGFEANDHIHIEWSSP